MNRFRFLADALLQHQLRPLTHPAWRRARRLTLVAGALIAATLTKDWAWVMG